MAEYIERETCLEKVCEACNMQFGDDAPCEPSECFMREKLMAIPTAEVEPVVHGRWIWNENACTWDCSNCNGSVGAGSRISKYAHCPFCGARMDGGADNG